MKIAEVAARSGFTTPTLRYYEKVGVLPVPSRTDNGYRDYDPSTLDRLAFVRRAKQLGCSLEEITELAATWEGGRCEHVQAQLRRSVDAKIADAQGRIGELVALVADLQAARASLDRHTPDGPCDAQCGCTMDTAAAASARPEPTPVALTGKPVGDAEVPIACSLGAGAVEERIAEWQALVAQAGSRERIDGGVRLGFGPGTPVEAIARLAAAEQDCCRFFAFAVTVDHRGTALEVRAPADAQDVVTAMFGAAR